jgi:N-acetylmuramic acid 6-phosphate etherase
MVLSGKVVSNLMVDVKATNEKLRARCVSIVCELTGLSPDDARVALEKNGWDVRQALEPGQ